MSLLVTGSIGLDSVATPHGEASDVLGGSAVYFSFAASLYTPVRLVGAVGDDFPAEARSLLESRPIDLAGLEARLGSKTFRWVGRYDGDMNVAETVAVDLNVLAEQAPTVPEAFVDTKHVFLANTHPSLQRELLAQVRKPSLVVCDTMNLWIETERDSLIKTLGLVNGVIINDDEARQLSGKVNLVEAGEVILGFGPNFVMIKKGEHGVMMVAPDGVVAVPAFPTKQVCDPTGAGDSFAGGVLGYLTEVDRFDREALKRSLVHGTVTASFAIEDFSLRAVRSLTSSQVNQRVDVLISMLRFD